MYYERKHKDQDTPEAVEARAQIAQIKKARQWGQPYVSSNSVYSDSQLIPVPSSHGMRSRYVLSCS